MIIEMRTYTLRPGTTAEYFRIYEAEGLALQRSILGNYLGSYRSEIGPLNQVVHLWGFDSLDERQSRRDRLAADPQWQRAVALFIGFFVAQESKILLPAAFTGPIAMVEA